MRDFRSGDFLDARHERMKAGLYKPGFMVASRTPECVEKPSSKARCLEHWGCKVASPRPRRGEHEAQ